MAKPGDPPIKPRAPKPKTVKVVCDVCGQDWKAHGTRPTLEDCVPLLKAELAKRPVYQWPMAQSGSTVTQIPRVA
jgi:hypothetical protein